MSELILQASGFRTSISEKAQLDGALTSAGVGLTVNVVGKVIGGSVSDAGIVVITGDNTAASVGAAVTLTMTPTLVGGTLTWSCAGVPSKYFPASCR